MDIVYSIKNSITSLSSNKVRTSLTVLGIVIGIAAIIIVFSAGAAIERLILSEVESFGTDIIQTEIKIPTSKSGMAGEQDSAAGLATGVQITTLSLEDMEDINRLPNISGGYSAILSQKQISYSSQRKKTFLMGTNASFINIDKTEIDKGRFYTEDENKSLAQVTVIGLKIKEELFGESDALGKWIKIADSKYRVIGVTKERGSVFTMDFDNYVYVPIKTLQKKLMGIDYVTYMVHKLKNTEEGDKTAEKMRAILRNNHNIEAPYNEKTEKLDVNKDDFRVTTMDEMINMLDIITSAITILLLAIVGISLVVGGVGIMNIMYVIVNERTSEIGLRKAVGAQKGDILIQFLIESIIITLLGGIIGIIIGAGISYLISKGASYYGLAWAFSIPLKSLITAFIFSIFFGVMFGLYPAKKAAEMDPITALRLE
ncbi:ABC transporter permease [bacterium]|nr:ABC transporter permease [bacterium]